MTSQSESRYSTHNEVLAQRQNNFDNQEFLMDMLKTNPTSFVSVLVGSLIDSGMLSAANQSNVFEVKKYDRESGGNIELPERAKSSHYTVGQFVDLLKKFEATGHTVIQGEMSKAITQLEEKVGRNKPMPVFEGVETKLNALKAYLEQNGGARSKLIEKASQVAKKAWEIGQTEIKLNPKEVAKNAAQQLNKMNPANAIADFGKRMQSNETARRGVIAGVLSLVGQFAPVAPALAQNLGPKDTFNKQEFVDAVKFADAVGQDVVTNQNVKIKLDNIKGNATDEAILTKLNNGDYEVVKSQSPSPMSQAYDALRNLAEAPAYGASTRIEAQIQATEQVPAASPEDVAEPEPAPVQVVEVADVQSTAPVESASVAPVEPIAPAVPPIAPEDIVRSVEVLPTSTQAAQISDYVTQEPLTAPSIPAQTAVDSRVQPSPATQSTRVEQALNGTTTTPQLPATPAVTAPETTQVASREVNPASADFGTIGQVRQEFGQTTQTESQTNTSRLQQLSTQAQDLETAINAAKAQGQNNAAIALERRLADVNSQRVQAARQELTQNNGMMGGLNNVQARQRLEQRNVELQQIIRQYGTSALDQLAAQAVSPAQMVQELKKKNEVIVDLTQTNSEPVNVDSLLETKVLGVAPEKADDVLSEQFIGKTADGLEIVRLRTVDTNGQDVVSIRAKTVDANGQVKYNLIQAVPVTDTSKYKVELTEADTQALFSAQGLSRKQIEETLLAKNPNADPVKHTLRAEQIRPATEEELLRVLNDDGMAKLIKNAKFIAGTENKEVTDLDDLAGDSAAAGMITRVLNGANMDSQTFGRWINALHALNDMFSKQEFDKMEQLAPGSVGMIYTLRQGNLLNKNGITTQEVAQEAAKFGFNQARGLEAAQRQAALEQVETLKQAISKQANGAYPRIIDELIASTKSESTTPEQLLSEVRQAIRILQNTPKMSDEVRSALSGLRKTEARLAAQANLTQNVIDANNIMAKFMGTPEFSRDQINFEEEHSIRINPLPTILGAMFGRLSLNINTTDRMLISYDRGNLSDEDLEALNEKLKQNEAFYKKNGGSKLLYDIASTYQKINNIPGLNQILPIPQLPIVFGAYSRERAKSYNGPVQFFDLSNPEAMKRIQEQGRYFTIVENLAQTQGFNEAFAQALANGQTPEDAIQIAATGVNYLVTDPTTGEQRRMTAEEARQTLAAFSDVHQLFVNVKKVNQHLTSVPGSIPVQLSVPEAIQRAVEIGNQSVGTQIDENTLEARGLTRQFINNLNNKKKALQQEANKAANQHDLLRDSLQRRGASYEQAIGTAQLINQIRTTGQITNVPKGIKVEKRVLNGDIGAQYGLNGRVFTAAYDNVVAYDIIVEATGEKLTAIGYCGGNLVEFETPPAKPKTPDVKMCLGACLLAQTNFSIDQTNGAAITVLNASEKANHQDMFSKLNEKIEFLRERMDATSAPVVQQFVREFSEGRVINGKFRPYTEAELAEKLAQLPTEVADRKVYDNITLGQMLVSLNENPELLEAYVKGSAAFNINKLDAELIEKSSFNLNVGPLFNSLLGGLGTERSVVETAAGPWSEWEKVPGTNLERRYRQGPTRSESSKSTPLGVSFSAKSTERLEAMMQADNQILTQIRELCDLLGIENPSIAQQEYVAKMLLGINAKLPREDKDVESSKEVEYREQAVPEAPTTENGIPVPSPSNIGPDVVTPDVLLDENGNPIPTPSNQGPGTQTPGTQTGNQTQTPPAPPAQPPATQPQGPGAPVVPANPNTPTPPSTTPPTPPGPDGNTGNVGQPNPTPPSTGGPIQTPSVNNGATVTTEVNPVVPTPAAQGETSVDIKNGDIIKPGFMEDYNNQFPGATNTNIPNTPNQVIDSGLTSEGSVTVSDPTNTAAPF